LIEIKEREYSNKINHAKENKMLPLDKISVQRKTYALLNYLNTNHLQSNS